MFFSDPDKPEPAPRITDADICKEHQEFFDGTVYAAGRFWRCEVDLQENSSWVPLPDDHVAAEVFDLLEGHQEDGVVASRRRIDSIINLLRLRLDHTGPWAATRLPDGLLPLRTHLLDLAKRELTPHRGDRFPGPTLPYDFEPDARCTAWKDFLWATVPPATTDFLQEFAGYCLTSDTHHELVLWVFDPENAGQSTLLLGLHTLLGQRAGELTLDDLAHRRLDPNYFFGKTLLVSHDPHTDPASVRALSALASGEPLTLSGARGMPVTVHPGVKLALAFSSLPSLDARLVGLYHRAALVAFPYLPRIAQDPMLKTRIAREGPGLLSWALAGLRRLQERGHFDIPAAMLAATAHVRLASAGPAAFVESACLPDPNARTQAAHLQHAYVAWCRSLGLQPANANALAAEWRRQGFDRHRIKGLSYWFGVSLLPSAAASQSPAALLSSEADKTQLALPGPAESTSASAHT